MAFTVEQHFYDIQFADTPLEPGDYENCSFVSCNFANFDLTGFEFVDCRFEECDFSMAIITGTAFKGVHFENCKLLGLSFDRCNEFLLSMTFSGCQLTLASFQKLKLKNTSFASCNLREVDFTQSDLTGSTLAECDLAAAIFENTNLEKADLRSAFNFSIDPSNNRIRKAKFSRESLSGLLDKFGIIVE